MKSKEVKCEWNVQSAAARTTRIFVSAEEKDSASARIEGLPSSLMPWLVFLFRTIVAPVGTSLLGWALGKATPLGQFSIMRPAGARTPASLAQGISSKLTSSEKGSIKSGQ